MSTNSGTKINRLLQQQYPGTVLLASWLKKNGISDDLQHSYIRSGWLQSIGRGAFIRSGDQVDLTGALYALQEFAGKPIHVGGRTALGMLGLSHYVELYQKETLLFAPRGVKLPEWFKNYAWETAPVLINSSAIPEAIGLINQNVKSYPVLISNPARALLECLDLAPTRFDLVEAWQIMEGLSSIRPGAVQEILEQTRSVKAVRLFLYLAEKANHPWFKYLDISSINLGKGKRSIVKNGTYISKYQITVPEVLGKLGRRVDKSERNVKFNQILWDYNIPEGDIEAVFRGQIPLAGHYDRYMLFRKILETYPWFTILQLFTPAEIQELLTNEVIEKLRVPSLRKQYEFVKLRLQEVVPITG